ncbi:MAG: monovalent cation/H+ antiporter subunit D family protein [Peptostreptococcaceae bacterium]|nr:monovalent cation/H+ antiporter subunit D family protein [Peptostreptococcaceae bacterium]
MNFLALVPIVFPMALAGGIHFIEFKNESYRRAYLLGGVILNFLFAMAVLIAAPPAMHIFKINGFMEICFKIDGMSRLFLTMTSFLWICTTAYSFDYMHHEGKENKFFTYFLITLGVIVGISLAGNIFTFYIFYEFLTLSTFPLVIHTGTKEALASGKKYLIYSFSGATLVLLGMILLFSVTGTLEFVPGGVLGGIAIGNRVTAAYVILFLGFSVKAAMVPFHSWLPAAMVAPTPVSSLLHAVAVVKSGIFALIRITFYLFGAEAVKAMHIKGYMSIPIVLTILMGSFVALHQDNLKKRLAYSTISQLGYIMLGIILLNEDALTGALLHLINHAVIKITLFFCVGVIMYRTGYKTIGEIRGIGKKMPITMGCFSIASISLIGIPPTNGFVSKWYLAMGGLQENRAIFVVILLVSAILTAAYLMPIVIMAFFPGEMDREFENKEPPLMMLIPIVALTGITVALGLFPNVVLHFIQDIARSLI